MDNLKLIIFGFKDGLYDSIFFGIYVITTVLTQQQQSKQSINVLKRIRQCCLLGGLLMFSMIIFNYFLQLLNIIVTIIFGSQQQYGTTWLWLESTLSTLFSALWVLPLIFLSRIVTALWFQDIADISFKGRPQAFKSISKLIADTLFSMLIQILFLIQANLFYFFPIKFIGQLLSILHTSLLYSLYSFEYKWFNMGWELYKRLHYIERMWPYFFGFGLPLALVTHSLPNYYLNTACFAFLFPLFILSANETHLDLKKSDHKIPFFSGVVWISNKLMIVLP
ncbi:EI24 domain-containing protein tank [Dermatophagoides pteronyssinus]|uniref:Etoposide-induced protein 2.4 homolog n=1 Tax=Dermatophagoides pteronyssinus TaxID=6956 RepID=A0A6P6XR59_DERPT|nr:etoposide-induced protein 2.4 homolog [Dermatophagoides pteronyssinus]